MILFRSPISFCSRALPGAYGFTSKPCVISLLGLGLLYESVFGLPIGTQDSETKFWGFIGKGRCGVVLRNQPDRVTWIKRNELMIKPSKADKAAMVQ